MSPPDTVQCDTCSSYTALCFCCMAVLSCGRMPVMRGIVQPHARCAGTAMVHLNRAFHIVSLHICDTGLSCRWLMSLTLEELSNSGQYDFAVLQAPTGKHWESYSALWHVV